MDYYIKKILKNILKFMTQNENSLFFLFNSRVFNFFLRDRLTYIAFIGVLTSVDISEISLCPQLLKLTDH